MNLQKAAKEYGICMETKLKPENWSSISQISEVWAIVESAEDRIDELSLINRNINRDIQTIGERNTELKAQLITRDQRIAELEKKYAEAVKVIEFYSSFEHIRSFESDQMAILEVDEAHPENNKAFKFLKEHL